MLSSQAGLEGPHSPRFNGFLQMLKVVAALLLISSLSVSMVQAVPVPVASPTSAIALTACYRAPGVANGHCSAGLTPTDGVHSVAESGIDRTRPNAAALYLIPLEHQPELKRREAEEMVVLYRRKSIFSKIKAAFHHIGHAIKHAFKKVGEGIKHVAQKVGSGIKHAAQKVGHFIKTTGAKIAKVGLKIISTVQKVASKVVGFIPGIGKPLAKVMEGESEGLNKASDAIHAHIGGKLGQAMHRMDKAQKVVGYIPRSVIPDFEGLIERDADDYLVERDLGLWATWEDVNERSSDDDEVYMF